MFITGPDATRDSSQRGPTPKTYKIAVRRVITSPCAAILLLRLEEKIRDDVPYSRRRLVADVLAMGIVDPDSGDTFGEDMLQYFIDFAVQAEYVASIGEDKLLVTQRVSEERLYLNFLVTQSGR